MMKTQNKAKEKCYNQTLVQELQPQIKQTENLFYSPFSINIALQMLLEGTDKQTFQEIQETLKFPKLQSARLKNMQNIFGAIKLEKSIEIQSANALWLTEKFPLLKTYTNIIQNSYNGYCQKINFADVSARNTINQWCCDNTNKKIQEIIPPNTLDELVVMVLTNAVYFKGQWQNQFDQTQLQKFTSFDNTQQELNMMKLTSKSGIISYQSNAIFKAITLPYKGDSTEMMVILPKKSQAIQDIENTIMKDFEEFKNKFTKTSKEINIVLPKFKFETSYELNNQLQGMGIKRIFEPSLSNFTKLIDLKENPSLEGIYVSKVLHKAYIEVNEKGSKAAAVTAIITKGKSAVKKPKETEPINFIADHPFLFIIYNKPMDEILFIGKLLQPEKAI